MRRTVTAALLALGIAGLAGCGGPNPDQPGVARKLTPISGDRYYGGVFNLSEPEYIKDLFPLNIVDAYSYRVAAQVYEGLFKFDQRNLNVIPCLATSYELDPTSTVYTIKLRQGVYFHDDACFPGGKGREFKAQDVAYCFKQLCLPSVQNKKFDLFDGIVKGARSVFEQVQAGAKPDDVALEGVKVLDDYTIEITLEQPSSIFLYNLCSPGAFIFPREAHERYKEDMREKCVGTGPFTLSSIDENISIILKRNPNYYRKDEFGNQLPYLDAIHIRFIHEKNVELLAFKRGDLDMMYRLPADHIISILESSMQDQGGGYSQYRLEREPEMSAQLLTFNTQSDIFKNANVRKAFSFAIDRERILNRVLNGEGYDYGKYGITPPSFPQYDVTKIQGYTFNGDSARYYLQLAGYKNGTGFPTVRLDLNAEGERYTSVAIDIKKQLKDELNIEIELNIEPFSKISQNSMNGDFNIFRHAWIADYPNPQTFLSFFVSEGVPTAKNGMSYPNLSRYTNPKFDEYYKKAVTATSQEEAMDYFMKAEQLMINDAPVVVLWYDEGYRLVQSYVQNFPNNPMQFRDFTEVFLTPKKEAQATKAE
jgi:peptide/nickel transport system substrate-binding protein